MPQYDRDGTLLLPGTPEMAVYDRLRAMGCHVAVDPLDPEDCADVALSAVEALREAGYLPAQAVL